MFVCLHIIISLLVNPYFLESLLSKVILLFRKVVLAKRPIYLPVTIVNKGKGDIYSHTVTGLPVIVQLFPRSFTQQFILIRLITIRLYNSIKLTHLFDFYWWHLLVFKHTNENKQWYNFLHISLDVVITTVNFTFRYIPGVLSLSLVTILVYIFPKWYDNINVLYINIQ